MNRLQIIGTVIGIIASIFLIINLFQTIDWSKFHSAKKVIKQPILITLEPSFINEG